MEKPMSENERKGMELLRQHMERVAKMTPEERAEYDKEVEAFGRWFERTFMPKGHFWHTADEDDDA